MENECRTISCEEAKKMDMVQFLSSLGFQPVRSTGHEHWYLSPLRNEKTASFRVNAKRNIWYDFGIGKGGSLIDFGIYFYSCSVAAFLEKLASTVFHPLAADHNIRDVQKEPAKIQVIREKHLATPALLQYLHQRRIDPEVASRHCREVVFEINDREHAAIGFRNDDGGFELRNGWFKGSSSPKSVTTINGRARELSVFEGFFDFLSWQTILEHQLPCKGGFLILNSLCFFDKSMPFMDQHDQVHLYLDRDGPGRKQTEKAVNHSSKYRDESGLYKGYKDLNEWMQQIGKGRRSNLTGFYG